MPCGKSPGYSCHGGNSWQVIVLGETIQRRQSGDNCPQGESHKGQFLQRLIVHDEFFRTNGVIFLGEFHREQLSEGQLSRGKYLYTNHFETKPFFFFLMLTLQQHINQFRSSHPKMFCQKSLLKSFVKFTKKHLSLRVSFYQSCRSQACNFVKNRLWHRCFLMNFVKFLRTSSFTKNL